MPPYRKGIQSNPNGQGTDPSHVNINSLKIPHSSLLHPHTLSQGAFSYTNISFTLSKSQKCQIPHIIMQASKEFLGLEPVKLVSPICCSPQTVHLSSLYLVSNPNDKSHLHKVGIILHIIHLPLKCNKIMHNTRRFNSHWSWYIFPPLSFLRASEKARICILPNLYIDIFSFK